MLIKNLRWEIMDFQIESFDGFRQPSPLFKEGTLMGLVI